MFFFSSRRRHTRCALVTGVQTCALPIYRPVADRPDAAFEPRNLHAAVHADPRTVRRRAGIARAWLSGRPLQLQRQGRSEEHTSELQSLMRISYAVFCLKKKNTKHKTTQENHETKQTNKQVSSV